MKNLTYLNEYRMKLMGDFGDEHNGMFELKIKGETYRVMASDGEGWEHVSISHKHKIPSWTTMCKLKSMFFEDDEVVMQLHPAQSDWISIHPNCLHLWKPINQKIPTPPSWMVGPKELNGLGELLKK